jgi:DNA-binding MarR family transcriptional regulator
VKKHDPPQGAFAASFLLAQVGAHAAARFGEHLSPLGLSPPHAGILRVLSGSATLSQQQLAAVLKIHPSRLVALVDELESKGFVERRENPDDRRTYALHLTERGAAALSDIGRIAREHNNALCAALDEQEREQLARLLRRIADEQGLKPGVHPGFSRLGSKSEI